MERYTITKLEFLVRVGVPTLGVGVIFGAIAGILNALTGGHFSQALGVIAIVLTAIVATAETIALLFWIRVE